MPRLASLLVLIACSQSAPPPPPPVVAAPPPAPPAPAVLASERPALADGALALVPARAQAVAVASSLDDLDGKLGPALATFTAVTGLAPAGLSRTRPVGIALVDDGWLAFGYVDDPKAFDASVPAKQRTRRDQIGLISDSADTLAAIASDGGLAQDPKFRAAVAELHYGALMSAWRAQDGAIGIAVDGASLRVRVIGVASPGGRDVALARAAALREARQFGVIGIAGMGAPKALRDQHAAAVAERDRVRDELEAARARVAAELATQVGLEGTRPVERTFTAPAATVAAWLAPALATWRAPELQAKLATLDAKASELERKLEKASPAAFSSRLALAQTELDAKRMADLLGAYEAHSDPGLGRGYVGGSGLASLDGIDQAGLKAGGAGTLGHGGGGGTVIGGFGGRRSATVAISGDGDASLRAHLASRLARVRTCYDRALETTPALRASIRVTLVADSAGSVQATSAGAPDASLGSCVELAVRGTAGAAHDATATFTVELTPP